MNRSVRWTTSPVPRCTTSGVNQAMHTTALHVTHSRDEAAALADLRSTLADGVISVDSGQ